MNQKAKAATIAIDRVGRDEMNLAEFPLALLSERSKVGQGTFTRERLLTLSDGTSIQQSWCVTGSAEFGLPQPSDEDVLLGLLKIAADNDFRSEKVHFTQMSLLSILQWKNQGYYFKRLEQALARLKTTSILAVNAFWNNTTKSYQTCHFGVIDAYQLWERREGTGCSQVVALSSNWARFSKEFFASIQAGYLKPLDLAVYFSLGSGVSKRLYRFLDKKRYKKDQFSIGISQLSRVHLGLSESTCKYLSWTKRELDRAHRELIERGFLESAEYGRTKNGDHKITYVFNRRVPAVEQLILPTTEDSDDQASRLVSMLVDRGVSAGIAHELVKTVDLTQLEEQIDVFDHIQTCASGKPMTNPGGFLTSAIRNRWTLCPPGYVPRVVREERARLSAHAAEERARLKETQEIQQRTVESLRSSLSEETLNTLREEAFEQAKKQLGSGFKLRRDSRMVDAFLNGILHERFITAS